MRRRAIVAARRELEHLSEIDRDGAVTNLRWTCDTLTPIPLPELPSETEIRDAIMLDIAEALLELRFPESDGESVITLPFCFE